MKITTKYVVWGHGRSGIDAIREADIDVDWCDEAIASLDGHADAWQVTVSAGLVTEAEMDAEPSVHGYRTAESIKAHWTGPGRYWLDLSDSTMPLYHVATEAQLEAAVWDVLKNCPDTDWSGCTVGKGLV